MVVTPVTHIVLYAPLIVAVVVSHGVGVDPDGGATIPAGGPPRPQERDHRLWMVENPSLVVGF